MVGLEICQACFSYGNGLVLRDIDLTARAGEMVALLGPNGSGKTTLLKLASGVLRPVRGEVRLGAASLEHLKRKAIAQTVAVVPQQFHLPFTFTVAEVVMLGRVPYARPFVEESAADRQACAGALEVVGARNLAERRFDELSGGERQKVILAMALAQQPKLLLLDEPIVHLDIAHQVEILELVKRLNSEHRITILAAMHDLNLAALYFNRLVLLKEGRVWADGKPAEVLTESIINEVFSAEVTVNTHPVTGVPHVVVVPKRGDVDNKN